MLFSSGVHLVKALESLSRSPQEEVSIVGLELVKELESGMPLHSAMNKFPHAFSPFEVRLVQIGQETGGMAICLERLSSLSERNSDITHQVKSALLYPCFLLIGCLFCALVIPPFLFQGLFEFVTSLNVELPWITIIMARISNVLSHPSTLLALVIGSACLLSLFIQLIRKPEKRRGLYHFGHALPGIRGVLECLALVRFSYGLALMLEQGYPVHKALPLTIKSVNDPHFEMKAEGSVKELVEGSELSDCLARTEIFSPLFIQALRVGEETGRIPELIRKIAVLAEDQLQNRIELTVALLEPLTLTIMGVLVGVTAVAALLPLTSIIEGL